jgi:hypothetical protein
MARQKGGKGTKKGKKGAGEKAAAPCKASKTSKVQDVQDNDSDSDDDEPLAGKCRKRKNIDSSRDTEDEDSRSSSDEKPDEAPTASNNKLSTLPSPTTASGTGTQATAGDGKATLKKKPAKLAKKNVMPERDTTITGLCDRMRLAKHAALKEAKHQAEEEGRELTLKEKGTITAKAVLAPNPPSPSSSPNSLTRTLHSR